MFSTLGGTTNFRHDFGSTQPSSGLPKSLLQQSNIFKRHARYFGQLQTSSQGGASATQYPNAPAESDQTRATRPITEAAKHGLRQTNASQSHAVGLRVHAAKSSQKASQVRKRSQAAAEDLEADSPRGLFAAARAAALQAGEDQQSAKVSAAIAADAATLAASSAGLARSSAHSAAVAADRAACWAEEAAVELAEAAAAAEDLVLKLHALQTAQNANAKSAAVEALFRTAQSAANAAETLRSCLSEARLQPSHDLARPPLADSPATVHANSVPHNGYDAAAGLQPSGHVDASTEGRDDTDARVSPSITADGQLPNMESLIAANAEHPADEFETAGRSDATSSGTDSSDAASESPIDLTEVTRDDQVMMHRALQLARRGLGHTAPNPAVGCVILDRDGQVVGEGFHPAAGQPHAEVFALRGAGQAAEGGTAYVTLEPCNHHGRTPPCAQALIAAGIARVVVGVQDPNPLVAGAGMQTLRDAGIAVAGPCEEDACREVNREFMERMAASAVETAV